MPCCRCSSVTQFCNGCVEVARTCAESEKRYILAVSLDTTLCLKQSSRAKPKEGNARSQRFDPAYLHHQPSGCSVTRLQFNQAQRRSGCMKDLSPLRLEA